MITADMLRSCEKENLPELVSSLCKDDLDQLVSWLAEKDDNLRYKSFLLLQSRSEKYNDVYPYWNLFLEKLQSPNSFHRNIGLRLIAENVRWDEEGKFDDVCDLYLSFCDDEKPVTVRQCIQSLCKVVPYNTSCHTKIIHKLLSIDIAQRKESQQKLVLLDTISVLTLINKIQANNDITQYIENALTGRLLDKKSKQLVETQLKS